MIVNAYFALTVPDPGIAILNMGIVIFMALHIYFEQDQKDKKDIDGNDD